MHNHYSYYYSAMKIAFDDRMLQPSLFINCSRETLQSKLKGHLISLTSSDINTFRWLRAFLQPMDNLEMLDEVYVYLAKILWNMATTGQTVF